jgi:hypothetical protein
MRQIRELLHLKYGDAPLSDRAIAERLGVARSTFQNNLARVAKAGLTWPLPKDLTDEIVAGFLPCLSRGAAPPSHRTKQKADDRPSGQAVTHGQIAIFGQSVPPSQPISQIASPQTGSSPQPPMPAQFYAVYQWKADAPYLLASHPADSLNHKSVKTGIPFRDSVKNGQTLVKHRPQGASK